MVKVLAPFLSCRRSIQRSLKKQGLEFKLNTKVTSATRSGSEIQVIIPVGEREGGMMESCDLCWWVWFQVTVESAKGDKTDQLECDVLLVCVGRRPYTNNLGLEVSHAYLSSYLFRMAASSERWYQTRRAWAYPCRQ